MLTRELFTKKNNYILEPKEEITVINHTGGRALLSPGLQMKVYDMIFGVKLSEILELKVDVINNQYFIRLI